MERTSGSTRWDVWLPTAALAGATALAGLAVVSSNALQQREELALDGRILGLAHQAELALRDGGVESAASLLDELLESGAPDVVGLALKAPSGEEVVRAGRFREEVPPRTVGLFVGSGGRSEGTRQRGRGQWQPGHGRGRYLLHLSLSDEAGRPPLAAALLTPAALLAGLTLVALAVLGGRLLVRQQLDAAREAQRRRLEALGRAGAGLAHQLRNPLGTIKGSCQLVAEELGNGAHRRRLDAAVEEARRMERMLGLLLDYARPPSTEPRPVDLAQALEDAARPHPGVHTTTIVAPTAWVDPEHLRQVLDNLIANALTVSPEGEPVDLAASPRRRAVDITVADRGPGPGDDPEALFDPYVSRRGDGTGLGLAIARNLAETNGGALRLEARAGGGCTAVLTLPAAGPESA